MRRVVVIGAGMIGAAVAYRLCQIGCEVTVLEASRPAGGTSSRSFAWVNANNKPPRAYHELNAAGLAEHRRLAVELPGSGFQPVGELRWVLAADQRARLRQHVELLQDWGYTSRLIERHEAAVLLPGAALPPVGAADYAYSADDGWVAAAELIGHLLTAAVDLGAELRYPAAVERLVIEGGRVAGVVVGGQHLAADQVIDCGGPQAGRLLEGLGLRVARRASPGLLVVTEPAVSGIERVVHTPEIHLRPDGNGRLLIGSAQLDDELSVEGGVTRLDPLAAPCRELLRRVRALVPALADVGLETARVGWRPLPADGLSAVGPVPGLEGYYLVFTHSGITLGPLLGRLVAAEVIGGPPEAALSDFRPDRLMGGAER